MSNFYKMDNFNVITATMNGEFKCLCTHIHKNNTNTSDINDNEAYI